MPTLRPYQKDCLDSIDKAIRAGRSRFLCHLATGGGKTVIFAELIRKTGASSLVLAHRSELLQQAQSKLKAVGVAAQIEQGPNQATDDCLVVVASVQSLQNRLGNFDPRRFRLIIIDECHHAPADSYLKIVDYFRGAYVIGFTATPFRSDRIPMESVFTDGVVYSADRDKLTKQGFLAPLEIRNFQVDSLEDQAVIQAYRQCADGKKTIVFCQSVAHATSLADSFTQNGIQASAIHGKLDKKERQAKIKSFATNGTRVLTNFNVLTEGYDEPSIQCVIMARKTGSRALFEQMVGRGTRLHEGKSHLDLIQLQLAPRAQFFAAPTSRSSTVLRWVWKAFLAALVLALLAVELKVCYQATSFVVGAGETKKINNPKRVLKRPKKSVWRGSAIDRRKAKQTPETRNRR